MAFEQFAYSKSWKNPKDFPVYEPDEGRVRADLQLLHDEAADAINRLIAALNDPTAAAQIPFQPVEGLEAKTLQQAIEEVFGAVADAAAAKIVNGSVTKEKLAAALLRRVYGGRVWCSMNAPDAAHNPDTDFPVGQLWLRPGWSAENLAQEDWETAGGSAIQENGAWCFTTDGSADYMTASQLLQSVGKAGDPVLVHIQMGECSTSLQEMSLFLGGVEQTLEDGTFEAVLDQTGSLEILLRGQWPEEVTGECMEISVLTVICPCGAIPPDCEEYTGWETLLEKSGRTSVIQVPRTLWVQTDHGVWEEVIGEVLPVHRGGTGLCEVSKGALLYGTGTDTMGQLPAEEQGVLQWSDGKPSWIQPAELARKSGYLRTMTGSYEGTGGNADRTLTLPVQPKILLISADDGSCDTACLMDGGRSSDTYTYIEANSVIYYTAQVTLSKNVLTFTNERRGSYEDKMLTQHMNAEGVGYHWLAVY